MRLRKAPKQQVNRSGWQVAVVGAVRERSYHNYYADHNDAGYPIEGTVAVRLYFNGKARMTYGTLKITDSNFDDEITTMKAAAEDKAASLEAVGAV